MQTTDGLNRKVQLAFGSALLTLVVVGVVSYRGLAASSESDSWVRHTHEVLASLQDLGFAMRSIESSSRGFVLTGEECYSQSSRAAKLRAGQDQAIVGDLTVDNPVQQRQLPLLAKLAAERIQFSEMVMDLRRSQGLGAAAEVTRGGRGQLIGDQLQGVIRQMQEEELRLLGLRNADAKQRLGQTRAVLILGTVLGLLITAAAGWTVQRDSSGREAAEQALRDSEEKYRVLLNRDLRKVRSRARSTAGCSKRLRMPWWW
jgi:CHASE3 domain sensor protein